METCRSCKAFLQPEWDKCKICGAPRGADAPPPPVDRSGVAAPGSPPESGGGDRGRKIVLAATLGVVVLALVLGGLVVLGSSGDDEVDPRLTETAGPATDGDHSEICRSGSASASGATAYEQTAGYHGVEIWTQNQDFDDVGWVAVPPDDVAWNANVELVACVERVDSSEAEVCTGYEGGRTVTLHDATYEVILYAAADASEVTKTTVEGDGGCPLSDLFVDGELTSDYYKPAGGLDDLLRPYVEVPDADGNVPAPATPEVALPTTDAEGCTRPPFEFQLRRADGSESTVSFPYAWNLRFEYEPRQMVILTDFPVDPEALRFGLPDVPEGGTMVRLTFRPRDENRTEGTIQFRQGDTAERGFDPSTPIEVDLMIDDGPRDNGDPQGAVVVTRPDNEFLCLDVDLRSAVGTQAVGSVAAPIVQADDVRVEG
jgi:hypothetical protein